MAYLLSLRAIYSFFCPIHHVSIRHENHIFASCDHIFCSTRKIFYVWVYPNMTFISIAKYFHWGPSVAVTVELISQVLACGDSLYEFTNVLREWRF